MNWSQDHRRYLNFPNTQYLSFKVIANTDSVSFKCSTQPLKTIRTSRSRNNGKFSSQNLFNTVERDLAANAAIVSIQLLLEEWTAPTVSVLDLGDHGKIRLVCTTPPIRLSYDLLATNWTNPQWAISRNFCANKYSVCKAVMTDIFLQYKMGEI